MPENNKSAAGAVHLENIGAAARERIAAALPDVLDTALGAYQLFMEQGLIDQAKAFKAHHEAAKTGIGHLEIIYRLAKKLEEDGCRAQQAEAEEIDLESLMQSAAAEINKYKDRQD